MSHQEIHIRVLTTMEELKQMQQVEAGVWQMDPIPLHHTFTSLQNGGIILGAYDKEEMVGFLYSFPGFKNGKVHLCSHMLGILPAYQHDGIGVKMKMKQAELAQSAGYPMITWTFDPLESRNAYLNLHKLEAIGARYNANYYGAMNDGLNQGLPTDRIQIEWHLNQQNKRIHYNLDEDQLLIGQDEAGGPEKRTSLDVVDLSHSNIYFAGVPKHFQEMKQEDFELAKRWRMETRSVFQRLFAEGFTATDLLPVKEDPISYYVFTK